MTRGGLAPGERIAALHRRLEQSAERGEWDDVAGLLHERDGLLSSVRAADREHALLEARRCTDRLATLARAAQRDCAAELKELRRGRRSTAQYVTIQHDAE